jgi:hypothetical protein
VYQELPGPKASLNGIAQYEARAAIKAAKINNRNKTGIEAVDRWSEPEVMKPLFALSDQAATRTPFQPGVVTPWNKGCTSSEYREPLARVQQYSGHGSCRNY